MTERCEIWGIGLFVRVLKFDSGRSGRAPIASGGGMRRSEEARVSEEAVRRKGGKGGPRKLGMGYGEAEEPV